MRRLLIALVSFCAVFQLFAASALLKVEQLRCEYLNDPIGIDVLQPRFSWVLESGRRGQMQYAYQVLVASSEAKLRADQGDLWDTGKVNGDQSIQVVYAGQPLQSRQRCYWKVRVWDELGTQSKDSPTAWFEMGLLSASDWRGQWIARTADTNSNPAPLLRRAFEVTKRVKRARAYICGLAYYELHLNGAKIGDHVLDPGYTCFDQRALYVTYDVTRELREGKNAIGVMLGNGWYNVHSVAVWFFDKAPWRAAPKLKMNLVIDYTDGTTETIATDEQWKTSTGGVTWDSVYGGEAYDARLEKDGWDKARYDDSKWAPALVVAPPRGKLVAQMMPPIKVNESFKPVKLTQPKPGVYVYDFGQNMAGFVKLSISGPAGTEITMKYSEQMGANGMINSSNIAVYMNESKPPQRFQTDSYILKGKGVETWNSRFVYHGFQYVEVTGAAQPLTLDNLTAQFIHTALTPVGSFECSNPLFNRIAKCARYSYLSNLQSIPTDCPHREKNGWTGDAHIACEQALFSFDGAPLYTKWINDMEDAQTPKGAFAGIIPTSGWGYGSAGAAWDSAMFLIPDYMYEYCGDRRILEAHYGAFKRYIDYLTGRATNGIIDFALNDWAPAKTHTPNDITSTAYYYRDTLIAAKTAALLGLNDEAEGYKKLAADIKTAFNKKFFHPDTGSYGNGSQTSLSCALYQGLAEEASRARVLELLVRNIESNDNHIDTGILGAKYLLHALTDMSRADVAFRLASQKTFPSWGCWLEQGATTLWEQWDGTESRNHIMYGDIVAWFYRSLAGINPDPKAPGFKHFNIKPNVVGDLKWARASYDSIHGRIVSDWIVADGRFTLKLEIPVNTTATVFLPTTDWEKVLEGKELAAGVAGIKNVRNQGGKALVEVGSGKYQLSCPLASSK